MSQSGVQARQPAPAENIGATLPSLSRADAVAIVHRFVAADHLRYQAASDAAGRPRDATTQSTAERAHQEIIDAYRRAFDEHVGPLLKEYRGVVHVAPERPEVLVLNFEGQPAEVDLWDATKVHGIEERTIVEETFRGLFRRKRTQWTRTERVRKEPPIAQIPNGVSVALMEAARPSEPTAEMKKRYPSLHGDGKT